MTYYESGMGLKNGIDDTRIPPIVRRPTATEVKEDGGLLPYVYFDLETTGLQLNCDIIQLAACCISNIHHSR